MSYNEIDICEGKHGGDPESVEAFLTVDSESQRQQVIAVFKVQGNLAPFEVKALLGFTKAPSSPHARCSELKAMNWLFTTKERRLTPAGCWARVLRLRNETDPPIIGLNHRIRGLEWVDGDNNGESDD